MIEENIEEIVIDKTAMISHEDVMVTISRDGYAKRVSLRSYGAAGEAMTGIKEGDELLGYVQSNTINHLLFFTTAGTYGYVPVYALEEGKWKEIGSHVNSLIRMTSNEKLQMPLLFLTSHHRHISFL